MRSNEPLLLVDAVKKAKAPLFSGVVYVVVFIIGSIISGVLIVVCNKEVLEHGFPFPLTMSFVAYLFTYVYYKFLEFSGAWKKGGDLPVIENVKVALSSICSISFMNLCLLTNTVAIYQISKFAVIPCTLVIQKYLYTVNTNWKVLLSLVVILSGVVYASGKGFESGTMSIKGSIFALFAIVSTSVYRIWQETKQKEFKIGPMDFQATMAGWQAGLGLVFAVVIEFPPTGQSITVPQYFMNAYIDGFGGRFPGMLLWLLGVCLMALMVNFTSFGLIGKTGPIAYAVVGHAKTVLTIAIGILLFPQEENQVTILADIVGCCVALVGVISYTHFEMCLKNNKPDCITKMCEQKGFGNIIVVK